MNIDKGIRPRFEEASENDEVYVAAPTQQDPETWTLSKSEQKLIYPEEETGEGSNKLPRIYEEELEEEMPIRQEIDQDDEGPQENEWRILTEEERATAYGWNMQDRLCAYCNIRVYCAKNTCDCPWMVRIQTDLQKDWKREQPTQ